MAITIRRVSESEIKNWSQPIQDYVQDFVGVWQWVATFYRNKSEGLARTKGKARRDALAATERLRRFHQAFGQGSNH